MNKSETETNTFKPKLNLPPPLPGVFVFDQLIQQSNISQVDSCLKNPSEESASTFDNAQCINKAPSFPANVVLAGGLEFDEAIQNIVNAEQAGFNHLSAGGIDDYSHHADQKGFKPLQPVAPSHSDPMIPPITNTYHSLQPVPLSVFEVPSYSETKVYQQLKSQNEYGKDFDKSPPHKPDFDDERRLKKDVQDTRMLNPVETRINQPLRPAVSVSEQPQYASSKLYQQLCQPPREMKTSYRSEVQTYHQLIPVTVSHFEQNKFSNVTQSNHNLNSNSLRSVYADQKSISCPQTQRNDVVNQSMLHSNLKHVNIKSKPSTSIPASNVNVVPPSIDLKNEISNKSQTVIYKKNKPKVYLELRKPVGKSELDMKAKNYHSVSQNQTPLSKIERQDKSTPLIKITGNDYRELRLPGPYEFNLQQSTSPNKYRLPKILGPNEYNSPQIFNRVPDKVQNTVPNNQIIGSSIESGLVSSPSNTFRINNYIEPSVLTNKIHKTTLSLPKNPVCYGDASGIQPVQYHNEKRLLATYQKLEDMPSTIDQMPTIKPLNTSFDLEKRLMLRSKSDNLFMEDPSCKPSEISSSTNVISKEDQQNQCMENNCSIAKSVESKDSIVSNEIKNTSFQESKNVTPFNQADSKSSAYRDTYIVEEINPNPPKDLVELANQSKFITKPSGKNIMADIDGQNFLGDEMKTCTYDQNGLSNLNSPKSKKLETILEQLDDPITTTAKDNQQELLTKEVNNEMKTIIDGQYSYSMARELLESDNQVKQSGNHLITKEKDKENGLESLANNEVKTPIDDQSGLSLLIKSKDTSLENPTNIEVKSPVDVQNVLSLARELPKSKTSVKQSDYQITTKDIGLENSTRPTEGDNQRGLLTNEVNNEIKTKTDGQNSFSMARELLESDTRIKQSEGNLTSKDKDNDNNLESLANNEIKTLIGEQNGLTLSRDLLKSGTSVELPESQITTNDTSPENLANIEIKPPVDVQNVLSLARELPKSKTRVEQSDYQITTKDIGLENSTRPTEGDNQRGLSTNEVNNEMKTITDGQNSCSIVRELLESDTRIKESEGNLTSKDKDNDNNLESLANNEIKTLIGEQNGLSLSRDLLKSDTSVELPESQITTNDTSPENLANIEIKPPVDVQNVLSLARELPKSKTRVEQSDYQITTKDIGLENSTRPTGGDNQRGLSTNEVNNEMKTITDGQNSCSILRELVASDTQVKQSEVNLTTKDKDEDNNLESLANSEIETPIDEQNGLSLSIELLKSNTYVQQSVYQKTTKDIGLENSTHPTQEDNQRGSLTKVVNNEIKVQFDKEYVSPGAKILVNSEANAKHPCVSNVNNQSAKTMLSGFSENALKSESHLNTPFELNVPIDLINHHRDSLITNKTNNNTSLDITSDQIFPEIVQKDEGENPRVSQENENKEMVLPGNTLAADHCEQKCLKNSEKLYHPEIKESTQESSVLDINLVSECVKKKYRKGMTQNHGMFSIELPTETQIGCCVKETQCLSKVSNLIVEKNDQTVSMNMFNKVMKRRYSKKPVCKKCVLPSSGKQDFKVKDTNSITRSEKLIGFKKILPTNKATHLNLQKTDLLESERIKVEPNESCESTQMNVISKMCNLKPIVPALAQVSEKAKHQCESIERNYLSQEVNSTPPIRTKRKYTKRTLTKKQLADKLNKHEKQTKKSFVKKYAKNKFEEEDDSDSAERRATKKLKLEFIDPLEEGLISDDDGEVVFLGFDVPDEEDETILGFDFDSSKEDMNESISSLLGHLESACVTVECDPGSLLQAPPSTTSCSQCGLSCGSHLQLVQHMQVHSNTVHSHYTQSFTCTTCFRAFHTEHQLSKHIKWTHEGGKRFNCPICAKRFTTRGYVKKHVETIHGEINARVTFLCEECPKSFSTEKKLKSHEDKIHKRALHQCDKCSKYFVKLNGLKRHKCTYVEEEVTFPCAYCDLKFSSRNLLHAHWLVHSEKKSYECEICNSKFSTNSSLKRHKTIHSEEKLFRCEICQKSFSLLSSLKGHLLTHTENRRFQCKLCKKNFSRRDVLNAHQWVHTGERKFQCDICLLKFRWRHAVKSHKLIHHSKEKPFACEICGKCFSHPDSYKKHAEVHAEKTYYCQLCLKAFSRPATLKAHILTHTDVKPFFCDMCNKPFRSKSHLRNHFLVHTKEKPWLCKFCNKTYKDRNQLQRHKRVVHCKAFYKKILPDLPKNFKFIENFGIVKESENLLSFAQEPTEGNLISDELTAENLPSCSVENVFS